MSEIQRKKSRGLDRRRAKGHIPQEEKLKKGARPAPFWGGEGVRAQGTKGGKPERIKERNWGFLWHLVYEGMEGRKEASHRRNRDLRGFRKIQWAVDKKSGGRGETLPSDK